MRHSTIDYNCNIFFAVKSKNMLSEPLKTYVTVARKTANYYTESINRIFRGTWTQCVPPLPRVFVLCRKIRCVLCGDNSDGTLYWLCWEWDLVCVGSRLQRLPQYLDKMFRAIVLIASLISASAFAPIGRNVARSSLKVISSPY